jgi:hypothetical protein
MPLFHFLLSAFQTVNDALTQATFFREGAPLHFSFGSLMANAVPDRPRHGINLLPR